MTQIKKLHLDKTLDDLDKRTAIPDVRTEKIQILLKIAQKLYKEAEKYYGDGDEELAYVFFMRYFNLLSCMRQKSDYVLHRQNVRQILGGKASQKVTINKLEALSKSLSKRYLQLSIGVTENSDTH